MRSKLQMRFSLSVRLLVVAALAWLPPLAASAQERVLRVIGDENYPPYLFLDADGQEDGFLVDVWKLWERKTGIRVELKATQWAVSYTHLTLPTNREV